MDICDWEVIGLRSVLPYKTPHGDISRRLGLVVSDYYLDNSVADINEPSA